MSVKSEKKTYQYTVTFTVETSRELKPEDLEEKVAAVWDELPQDRKLFVNSYGFTAELL